MPKQNKRYEIEFFGAVAESGHYETQSDDFYAHIFQVLAEQAISLTGKVLECGCGTGAFGRRFLAQYPRIEKIVGVDLSEPMIAACAAQHNPRYQAQKGDLEDVNIFPPEHFAVAICPFILHHFPDIESVISNISQWLEPGGQIIIIEPNGNSPVNRFFKLARHVCEKIFGPEWLIRKRLATPNETDHTLQTYRSTLENNGFTIISVKTFTIKRTFTTLASLDAMMSAMRQFLALCVDSILANSTYAGTSAILIAQKSHPQ